MEDPLKELYTEHIDLVCRQYDAALAALAAQGKHYAGIVFAAGGELLYHADDQPIPYRPTPHFARWAPVQGPDHLLIFRPGETPTLIRVVPRDYWYEPPAPVDHPYPEVLPVEVVATAEDAIDSAGEVKDFAYVGYDLEVAEALGIDEEAIEPEELMARLDWLRGLKTPYEVECIRLAADRAAPGHATVRSGARSGHSERALHAAYLAATAHLETELPYANIIAWNEHAATLHYQSKDRGDPPLTANLLIDAGAEVFGYASDITRTYPQSAAPLVFREIVDRLDTLQRKLVDAVRPGRSYVELHEAAHRGIADILHETGVLKVSAEEAFERQLTDPFFPHGLGHHLGLQVHDVGGRQAAPEGGVIDPPPRYPYLRTTREMAAGQVLTIEPGIYFIPLLLEPHRQGGHASAFDWKLIDEELIVCGGVRIEDDVLCTEDGPEDLSRPAVGGHRD